MFHVSGTCKTMEPYGQLLSLVRVVNPSGFRNRASRLQSRAGLNSLCRSSWSQTFNLPISGSWVPELQACASKLGNPSLLFIVETYSKTRKFLTLFICWSVGGHLLFLSSIVMYVFLGICPPHLSRREFGHSSIPGSFLPSFFISGSSCHSQL